MVDIPSNILSGGAIDGFAVPDFEKILSANAIRFVFGDDVAPVFNNEPTLWNGNVRKHAQARSAFARHNIECGFAGDVGHRRKITAKNSRNLEKSLERYGRSLKEKSFSTGTLKYAARRKAVRSDGCAWFSSA